MATRKQAVHDPDAVNSVPDSGDGRDVVDVALPDGDGDQALRNADESRAVGDPAPSWAADDEGEVPEVLPAARREQLERLRGLNKGPTRSTDLVVNGPRTAQLHDLMRAKASETGDVAAQAMEDMTGRILDAESLDALMADDEPLDAEDILGVPMQLWGTKVNESDFVDGMPFYCVIEAKRLDTGEDVIVTCGAWKVAAKLLKADRMKWFPFVVTFEKAAKPTRQGYYPLDIKLVK
jgi:hypothetical protein